MSISRRSVRIKILVPVFLLVLCITFSLFAVILTTDHNVSKKYFEHFLSRNSDEIMNILETAIGELVTTQLLDNSFVVEAKQKVAVQEIVRYLDKNNLRGAILGPDGSGYHSSLDQQMMDDIRPFLAKEGHFHLERAMLHTNGQIVDFPAWKWKIIVTYPSVNWLSEMHQKELVYLLPVVIFGMGALIASVFVIFRKNFQQPVAHILSDLKEADSVSMSGIDELDTIAAAINEAFSRRRQAEEEIRHLNIVLEEKVRRRTAELTAANQELEAFAYSVSHDLRAPLRAVDGFSQALLEDYKDKLDDEGKDLLLRVRKASQRMGQLIDDILKLSRVTRGELVYAQVSLSRLAEEIISELQEADPNREMHIVVAKGITAKGDERMLRIVLENLLGNAWKFTGKKDQARIEFGVETGKGAPEYFVKDNGAGFDMAYSGKLFGTFQRLHREQEFPGTGIGLATVQRIIRRHGGNIRAESEMGSGATFYFTLGKEAEG